MVYIFKECLQTVAYDDNAMVYAFIMLVWSAGVAVTVTELPVAAFSVAVSVSNTQMKPPSAT